MSRSLLAFAVVLTACGADSDARQDATEGVFCETRLRIAEQSHRFVDILFVLGADRFALGLAQLIEILDAGSYPAMHIAVVSANSGAVDGDGWLSYRQRSDGTEDKSFDGSITDAVGALIPSGGATELLAAIDRFVASVDSEAPGFLRDGAALAVVILSDSDDDSTEAAWFDARSLPELSDSDDDSTDDPTAYANSLRASAGQRLIISVAAPDPSPRLRDFVAEFPFYATFLPLDNADIGEAMYPIAQMMAILLWSTSVPDDLDLTDLDRGAPGRQIDCTASDRGSEMETVVPRCIQIDDEILDPTTQTPCWWLRPTPWNETPYTPFVERTVPPPPWSSGAAEMWCVTCAQ